MTTMNGGATERQEIEALLPWHAAGTLSRRDAERVDQALAKDLELARHYDVVREELNETIHLNESLGAPSARAMEKLFAAIDAESARAPRRRSLDVAGRFAQFLANLTPRTLVWSASAAALAIMVQAAALTTVVVNDHRTPGTYKVAGIESNGHVRVRFSSQASAQEITNFLDTWNATLVDGPKGGFFTLRFANNVKKEDLIGIIKQMQAQSKIVDLAVTAD